MSSWFFSISLSSPCWEERAEGVGRFSADGSQSSRDVCCGKAGAKNGQHHVGPHRGEREAKRDRDPIHGWSPSSSAELGLQARIRRSAKLSTIMPSFVRGGGPRRQVQIFATALKPEPGAAHCHLGAVRKRRWFAFLLISTVLALRSSLWPLAARRQPSARGEPRAGGNLAGLGQAPQRDHEFAH